MTDVSSAFLADCIDVEPFAASLNRKPVTIRRWMKAPGGLPFIRLGNRRLIHVPTAREWLLSRMRRPNPRRGSRPQKAALDQPACVKPATIDQRLTAKLSNHPARSSRISKTEKPSSPTEAEPPVRVMAARPIVPGSRQITRQ